MKSVKAIVYVAIVTLVFSAVAALGFWAGQYATARKFAQLIQFFEKGETLETVLNSQAVKNRLSERQRTEYYRVYYDGTRVKDAAGRISWSVKNVPTPFLGNAPWPGPQYNAAINTWQMRSARDLVLPKPAATFRIVMTGGSTAYGSGAPDQARTIGGFLERYLNALPAATPHRYEVFVLANPAWSSTHERIAIENRISEWQPDLVISFSGHNDAFWGEAGRNVLWFRAYADDFYWSLIKQAYEVSRLAPPPDVVHDDAAPVPAALVAERLGTNVRLAHYALALKNIDYLFVLQPALHVTRKRLCDREREFIDSKQKYFADCYRLINKNLQSITAPRFHYRDLSGVFDTLSAQGEIFLDTVHFGDKGNDLIAKALLKTLLALDLLATD